MAVVLVNTEKTFSSPVGFVPGVIDTTGFPEGLGGIYVTRRERGFSEQELEYGSNDLEEATSNPLLYDETSVGHERSLDGFILKNLPVSGEDGMTLFFVYKSVEGFGRSTIAANVASSDTSNTGAVNFSVFGTGSRIFLGFDSSSNPSGSLGRVRQQPDGFQYDAFGFNAHTKYAFISNRFGNQGTSGFTDGTIEDMDDPGEMSSDYYVFRGAPGFANSELDDRVALIGWYPRTLSESENNSLGEALIKFMSSIGLEMYSS